MPVHDEDRDHQPGRIGEGPAGARDDPRRRARRAPAARRHDRRADERQHRRRPGDRRRPARLQVRVRDDRQGRTGEGLAAAGLRRRGRRVPGRRAARATRRATTRRRAAHRRTRCVPPEPVRRTRTTREAHEKTTGPEIWRQTAGRITHFVAGAGTCGIDHRRRPLPEGAEPRRQDHRRRSRGLGVLRRLGPPVPRRGRRRGLLPRRVGARPARRRHPDQRRGELPHRPPRQPARRASSSAARAAWPWPPRSRWPRPAGPDDVVVVLNPDSGRGYLSRVFDDDWMANFGFLRECDQCVGAVLDARNASIADAALRQPAAAGVARRSS